MSIIHKGLKKKALQPQPHKDVQRHARRSNTMLKKNITIEQYVALMEASEKQVKYKGREYMEKRLRGDAVEVVMEKVERAAIKRAIRLMIAKGYDARMIAKHAADTKQEMSMYLWQWLTAYKAHKATYIKDLNRGLTTQVYIKYTDLNAEEPEETIVPYKDLTYYIVWLEAINLYLSAFRKVSKTVLGKVNRVSDIQVLSVDAALQDVEGELELITSLVIDKSHDIEGADTGLVDQISGLLSNGEKRALLQAIDGDSIADTKALVRARKKLLSVTTQGGYNELMEISIELLHNAQKLRETLQGYHPVKGTMRTI